MNRGAGEGPRWLESLARWSVRGDPGTRSKPVPAIVPIMSGTTRRTALRRAAGAAGALAVAGPLGLGEPPAARADAALEMCQSESFKNVFAVFQACVKQPLEELEETSGLLRLYEEHPSKNDKSKRAKRTVANLRRRRNQAIKDSEFCNVLFARERAEGEDACHAKAKPPGEPGSGGSTKAPGCEPGYLLCGEYCCDLHYATCQGCRTPTCCRIEGNCCPNG
jgi:hypothetical protein